MITHHPSHEMIVEYANGTLPSAESLLVASHASMCVHCRRQIAEYEDIAAALLEAGEEAPMAAGSLDALLARIDRDEENGASDEAPVEPAALDEETRRLVPPPLRPLLPSSLPSLRWRRIGRGIRQAELSDYGTGRVALLEIRGGQRVPSHTHTGNEYTLVLQGAFRDGDAHYASGDVALADPSVDHAPVADEGAPCLCLTIRDGRTRLTGPVGRLLSPVIDG